jgi:poly(beta-D-mannuronate) lyase
LPHKVESVSYYTDNKSSVVDLTLHARFLELRKVVADAQNFLATQNINFITSNSASRSSIAECSVKHLLQFAKDDAFTGSDDIRGGGAIRLMSVTPLITYLILRDAGSIEPEQDVLIRSWISRLVDRLLWLENKYKYDNNIEDWTGAAFALSAVALNRGELLEHAIQIARKKSQMINEDGFLPSELDRGQMAVDYNLSALQALSIIISVAQANGIDLLSPPSNDGLLRMMQRMLRIIEEPESFLPFATTPEAISSGHFDRQNMGWLLTYYLKSKDLRALKIICEKKPLYSWRTGGDWFILFGNPNSCS